MGIYLVLIPVTLALVALALWAFVWSVRHEQFDDLDREGYSILFDDDESTAAEQNRDDNKTTLQSENR